MARRYTLILSIILSITGMIPVMSIAQSTGYEIIPSPDLWYNDVDGIRIGLNLKGQVPGTFEDGPHRLDAGIWVGLWFPNQPISYYFGYTEPIKGWTDFGSEANIEFISSVRTGYHNHGIAFNKRWQQGFDERSFREVRIYQSFEKRFNHEYTAFENLWSDRNKFITSLTAEIRDNNRIGWYQLRAGANIQYLDDVFTVFTASATQKVEFNTYWGLQVRAYAGLASANTTPEYLYSRSMRPAFAWMNNGVTRAKGTIPQPWIESGNIQVAGGANIRGYTSADIESYQLDFECNDTGSPGSMCIEGDVEPLLFHSILSMNVELDYWNPITVILNSIPYASEFLKFRSYLFFDSGKSLGLVENEPKGLFSNAGAGFSVSLNIPDHKGKERGFVLRYENPFWLSDPQSEEAFKLRHLVGFGAVISF